MKNIRTMMAVPYENISRKVLKHVSEDVKLQRGTELDTYRV